MSLDKGSLLRYVLQRISMALIQKAFETSFSESIYLNSMMLKTVFSVILCI